MSNKFQLQFFVAIALAVVCMIFVEANNQCPTPTDTENFIEAPSCSGSIKRGQQTCHCKCRGANQTRAAGYYCEATTSATTKATTTTKTTAAATNATTKAMQT